MTDLGGLMVAREDLLAAKDFKPSRYPGFVDEARCSQNEATLAWFMLPEADAVRQCVEWRIGRSRRSSAAEAERQNDALDLKRKLTRIDTAIAKLRQMASDWILAATDSSRLDFDKKTTVRSLLQMVITGVGLPRPDAWYLPSGFRERERINDLLALLDPWKEAPKAPTLGQQVVMGLRAHGLSADEIEENLRASDFCDREGLQLIEELRRTGDAGIAAPGTNEPPAKATATGQGPAQRTKPRSRRPKISDAVRQILSRPEPFEGTQTDLAKAAGYTHPSSLHRIPGFSFLWEGNERRLAEARAARQRRMIKSDEA